MCIKSTKMQWKSCNPNYINNKVPHFSQNEALFEALLRELSVFLSVLRVERSEQTSHAKSTKTFAEAGEKTFEERTRGILNRRVFLYSIQLIFIFRTELI